ncbi:MAG TPA: hypothetical protein DCX12_04125 [Chloroflexi bacterium]|jgi:hypothetical protein|nr:hypothetical protein [Chloroflexota bacterium]
MNPLFDSAGLACVAYAEILGSAAAVASGQVGPSGTNSGVTATRVTTGQFLVFLPSNLQQAPYQHTTPSGSTVTSESDLVFVQPKASPLPNPFSGAPQAFIANVDPNVQVSGQVAIGVDIYAASPSAVATAADCDFTILVLRTIIPDV